MPWVAAVGAVAGGVIGAVGSHSAAQTQASAANRATDAQLQMFDTVNAQAAPWRQAGSNALDSIAGRSDFFNHQFSADDLKTNLAPNYQFTLDQGQGAVKNMATSSGGLFSGNTLKAISDYTTGMAQNSYQNAFSNFTANQSNIFNRLASVAGLGQQSNTTVAGAGATISGGVASSMMNAGTAAAGGIVGGTNAMTGGLNNATSWYMLPQIMNMAKDGSAGSGGGGGGGMDPSQFIG